MAGRSRLRRASSVSSVSSVSSAESVDKPRRRRRRRWTKESAILKPRPVDGISDDWPCYVLTDAAIYRKDGITLANPLFVHLEGSVLVRGYLEGVDEVNKPNLVQQTVSSGYIEISHSDQYSISDEPVALWVSGAAGWFEIKPSTKYWPVYSQVHSAIDLYYSAYVAYETYNEACEGKPKAQRPKPPTFDDIYLKYALRSGGGILRHEVEALCGKWAGFLISHFDKEISLDWASTAFAKSLRSKHPDVLKRINDIAKGRVPTPPPPSLDSLDLGSPPPNPRSRSARESSRNSVGVIEKIRPPVKRSRSPQPKPPAKPNPRMTESPVPLPEKYKQFVRLPAAAPTTLPVGMPKAAPAPPIVPSASLSVADAESESPVNRLLGVLQKIAGANDVKKAAPSLIHSKVFFGCKIRHYGDAKAILAYYAKDLLPLLGPEWKGGRWHTWLVGVAKQPWTPTETLTADDIPSQTLRRAKTTKPTPSNTPAAQVPPTISLKSRLKKPAQDESDDDSDDGIGALGVAPPMRGRKSGKNAGLRPISTKKRPLADLDDQPTVGGRGRKSAKFSQPVSDQDDDMEDIDEASDDEAAVGGEPAPDPGLPVPEGAVRVVVVAERLPTTSPKGPDGTWTCDQEGCTYVVRAAREKEAQELVEAHFRDHKEQAAKINLALKESRGHMPINHLLSKIQALGKAAFSRKKETVDGKPVVAPVNRKLLI
ncbi:hypothetical protein C8A05DRAFT_38890 [Staphylotrichum tortipilum]|uniref:Uncharacterized protein n=1 Tax=Staphylotrichum tortipilum TaxID=2831512 RepID=A0AAN6MAX4_9PEZI|nr:hypothetical protein C8A05DRAFT_38890 [Staphylotrichum longicolle]